MAARIHIASRIKKIAISKEMEAILEKMTHEKFKDIAVLIAKNVFLKALKHLNIIKKNAE